MEFLYEWGYLGLFIVSFLAATLIPLSPELLLLFLFDQGYSAVLLVLVATIAGYLGSLTNYYLAREGSSWIFQRYMQLSEEKLARYRRHYERWGAVVLFFSWLPVIGEPLMMVGGILQIRLSVFTFWVIVGRIARFSLLLLLASPLMQ